MTERPLASIIIDNYNYAHFLGPAIGSALDQTYPNTEVIVVDDGSTDGSADIIAGFRDRIVPIFKENAGQASAFNAGFDASRGAIVLFLDSDDLLDCTAVEQAVEAMTDPRVVKVQWPMREIDEAGACTGRLVPTAPLAAGDYRDEVIGFGPTATVNAPTSGNAWRRAFLSEVLPVPEHGDKHGADAYLFTLAPLFGFIHALQEPHGCYRIHPRSFSTRRVGADLRRDFNRYKNHCKALALHLRRMGIEPYEAGWLGPESPYAWMADMLALQQPLERVIPTGATFIFVDEDSLGGGFLPGRRALAFVERDGAYGGPPSDGAAAVSELYRLRRAGAEYIAIIRSCFWWLDVYPELREVLCAECPEILADARARVFDLRPLATTRRGGVPR